LIDLTNEDTAVVTGAGIYRYDAEIAVTFLGTLWNVIKQRIISEKNVDLHKDFNI